MKNTVTVLLILFFTITSSLAVAQCSAGATGKCSAGCFRLNTTTCATVGPGYYSPSGVDDRIACAAGTYSAVSNAASCTPCPAGSFTNYEGRTKCQYCPTASYTDQPGSIQCFPCAPSFYNGTGSDYAYQESKTSPWLCLPPLYPVLSSAPSSYRKASVSPTRANTLLPTETTHKPPRNGSLQTTTVAPKYAPTTSPTTIKYFISQNVDLSKLGNDDFGVSSHSVKNTNATTQANNTSARSFAIHQYLPVLLVAVCLGMVFLVWHHRRKHNAQSSPSSMHTHDDNESNPGLASNTVTQSNCDATHLIAMDPDGSVLDNEDLKSTGGASIWKVPIASSLTLKQAESPPIASSDDDIQTTQDDEDLSRV
jgi:hypothetical protein